MRLSGRLTATLAATLLMLGVAGVTLASGAKALPVIQIVGSAPAAVHGPTTVVFTYTITVPVAIDSTSFTTHQAAALPASATGATLDAVPVPAGQITQPNSVDITIHTGAAPTDGLAPGVHTITFNATVGGGLAVTTSSSATLSWIQASVPATLSPAAVAVAVNEPDIAVTNLVSNVNSLGPAEGTTGFVGTGMQVQLNVDVTNLGFGTPQTTLTITLPPGLVLAFAIRDVDADGGLPMSCPQVGSAPPRYNCALGSVPIPGGDPTIQIFVTTTAHPPAGTVGTVTVSAAPDAGEGTDTNPANDSASTPLKFTGLAALSYTFRPAATKIPIGDQTTVTLTIHNAGPQPAEHTSAFVDAIGDGNKSGGTGCCGFLITGFTGPATPPGVPGNRGPPGVPLTQPVEWFVGTIAPGSSVSAILTIKADTVGTGRIHLSAGSTATDPNCPNNDCIAGSALIHAISVQPTPTTPRPAATTSVPAAAPVALAATGPSPRPLLGLSLLLLLTGTTLTIAARRRQTR